MTSNADVHAEPALIRRDRTSSWSSLSSAEEADEFLVGCSRSSRSSSISSSKSKLDKSLTNNHTSQRTSVSFKSSATSLSSIKLLNSNRNLNGRQLINSTNSYLIGNDMEQILNEYENRSIIFKNPWSIAWPYFASRFLTLTLCAGNVLYSIKLLDSVCWSLKTTILAISLILSSLTIIENLVTLIIYFLRHRYRFLFELTVYYILCTSNLILIVINFLLAACFLMQRTCKEESLYYQNSGRARTNIGNRRLSKFFDFGDDEDDDDDDDDDRNIFYFIVSEFDTKIVALHHLAIAIFLTVTLVYFAIHKDKMAFIEVKRINRFRLPANRIDYPA